MDIRQTRRLLNLTQKQLADATGLSIGTINRIEKGGGSTLKTYTIIKEKLLEYAKHSNTISSPTGNPTATDLSIF